MMMTQLTEHFIRYGRGTRNLAKVGLPHAALWFVACNVFAISLFSQSDLVLSNNTNLASNTYQAGNSITAGPTLVIGGSSNVTFNAGSTIYLLPGFQTTLGDAFQASIAVFTPPTITTSSLSNGVAGTPYTTAALTALLGATPYTWSLTSVAPSASWLVLNSSTGVLSGTPPAANNYTVTVQVMDNLGLIGSKILGLTITAPAGLTITGTKVDATGTTPFTNPGATVTIDTAPSFGPSSTSYSATVSAGTHTLTSPAPSGYHVFYSQCTNCTVHPLASFVAGTSVTVNVPSPAGSYVDVTWEYMLPADVLQAFIDCVSATPPGTPPAPPPATCTLDKGTYTQSQAQIVNGKFYGGGIPILRPNVTVTGGSTDARDTMLVRGPDLVAPMMEVGNDRENLETVPLTGIKIQYLTFCSAGMNLTGRHGDPNYPCLQTLPADATLCEGFACLDLSITNTGAPQGWAAAAPPGGPFTNAGPYNVEVSHTIFEDNASGHPIGIIPGLTSTLVKQTVNDVYFHDNLIVDGGVLIGLFDTTNWDDYTQCDNWESVHGTVFAEDTTPTGPGTPRNIRFGDPSCASGPPCPGANTFTTNAGAFAGNGRYVGIYHNTFSNSPTNRGQGGGVISQEMCSDMVNVTGNTLTGGYTGNSGMEMYSRNLTISGNTVSGFSYEGIGVLGVKVASVTGNTLHDNDFSGGGNGDIKVATRYGGITCHPAPNPVTCDAVRDVQGLKIESNISSNAQYGIYLEANPDGSTNNIGIDSIASNTLNAPNPVAYDQRVNLNVNATDVTPSQVLKFSWPDTIEVFPEGSLPLGVFPAVGTPCITYTNTTPPVCSEYSKLGTFRFGANDPAGAYNIKEIDVFLGTGTNTDPHGPGYGGPYLKALFCHIMYIPPSAPGTNGIVYLDQNTIYPDQYLPNWSPGSAIGSGDPVTNAACTIYPATSKYVPSGSNDVLLYLDIQFVQNGTYYMYEAALNINPTPGLQSQGNGAASLPWSLWGYWRVGPVQ